MSENLEQLEQKIIDTFKDVPYPGDENIVVKAPPLDMEANQIENFFLGKSWKEIDIYSLIDGYVGDQSACLTFMTPEAFRYYLPAYILICIRNYELAGKSYSSTIWKLTRGFYPEAGNEWFDERIECLSNEIKKTIAEFVWTMHSLHENENFHEELDAFQSYWYQYYDPQAPEKA